MAYDFVDVAVGAFVFISCQYLFSGPIACNSKKVACNRSKIKNVYSRQKKKKKLAQSRSKMKLKTKAGRILHFKLVLNFEYAHLAFVYFPRYAGLGVRRFHF